MRTCVHCGGALPTGSGINNAKLCLDCWAEAIFRVESGEQQRGVAREFRVNEDTLYFKRRMYGQLREQG